MAGFTLTELLVSVAISALVLSFAIPSFARTMSRARVNETISDLQASIILVRSEALKRGRRVVMCVSESGGVCSTNGDWGVGWLVFEDRDDNGQRTDDEEILAVWASRAGKVTVTGHGVVRDYISYVASGRSQQITGALLMGTLTVCDHGTGKKIVVSHTGRPRIAEAECET